MRDMAQILLDHAFHMSCASFGLSYSFKMYLQKVEKMNDYAAASHETKEKQTQLINAVDHPLLLVKRLQVDLI